MLGADELLVVGTTLDEAVLLNTALLLEEESGVGAPSQAASVKAQQAKAVEALRGAVKNSFFIENLIVFDAFYCLKLLIMVGGVAEKSSYLDKALLFLPLSNWVMRG